MIKYERINGDVEFFTDDKEEFLKLVEQFKDSDYSFDGQHGYTFGSISYEEMLEMVNEGKNVFIEKYDGTVCYFYGAKPYQIKDGRIFESEKDWLCNFDYIDRDGITLLCKVDGHCSKMCRLEPIS